MLSYDRLAGLDSMVLDINQTTSSSSPNTVPSSPLDGISYVMIPRVRRKGKLERRAGRSPLGDKTHEFNVNNQKHTPLSHSPPLAKRRFLIHRDYPEQSTLHTPSNPSLPSICSFHPLPPVPSTSALRLPSFLDNSFHPTSPLAESVSQTLPVRRSRTRRPSVTFAPPAIVSETEIHNAPYSIPAFQHPNSPYVPWTPPTRHKILRPLSTGSEITMASSSYSRPSRSGAMAPEPGCSREKLHGVGRWRVIRRAFKQNIDQVRKRMRILAKPLKLHKFAVVNPVDLMRYVSDDSILDEPSPTRQIHDLNSPCLRSPCSFTSTMSTESNSLSEWLAERQREVMERASSRASLSLEEYERMGSWIDILEESCGVRGCEVHTTKCDWIAAQRFNEQEEDSPPNIPSPSQYRSAPTLPSMTSHWFDSEERLVRATFSNTASSQRARPASMPGGWTFPV